MLKLNRKKIISLGVQLLVLASVVYGIRWWQQRALNLAPPSFTAQTLTGKTAVADDKPKLIYFWASWCPICKLQTGCVNDLVDDYNVLTIAFQSGQDEQIKAYMNTAAIHRWPVINDVNGKLAQQFGIGAVPTMLFTNKSNNIQFSEVGYTTCWGLKARAWMTQR